MDYIEDVRDTSLYEASKIYEITMNISVAIDQPNSSEKTIIELLNDLIDRNKLVFSESNDVWHGSKKLKTLCSKSALALVKELADKRPSIFISSNPNTRACIRNLFKLVPMTQIYDPAICKLKRQFNPEEKPTLANVSHDTFLHKRSIRALAQMARSPNVKLPFEIIRHIAGFIHPPTENHYFSTKDDRGHSINPRRI